MVIEKFHNRFDLLYNRKNSNHDKTFSAAERDDFFNLAINEFVEICVNGENKKRYKLGFEVTQQRIDMLGSLVVGQPKQGLITPVNIDTNLNIYEFDFADLDYEYMHLIRAYAKVKGCGDKLFEVAIEQHDDLNKILKDEHRGPSKKWLRAVGLIKSSSDENTETSLYVYTNGEFEIEGLYIEYVKKPKEVALGTYNDFPTLANPNPGIKAQVNCDLPSTYHDTIVDIAVQEAARTLEDVDKLKLRDDRISGIMH